MKNLTVLIVIMLVACLLLTSCNNLTTPEPVTEEIEAVGTKSLSGVFDLTGWISPHDQNFNDCIDDLTTPYIIDQYMTANFTKVTSHEEAWSPYEMWLYKWGDCNDFSTFGIFMAHMHNYTTYQIYIKYTNGKAHMLGVYIEGGYDYQSNKNYYNVNLGNWIEVVEHHDNEEVEKTVDWAKLYDYDLDFKEYHNW